MANRIRELRKAKGTTMKQLGVAIGLAESTISQYETGKRQPDNATLCRISDYFGVSVDYLLGRDIEFAFHDGASMDIDEEIMADVNAFAAHIKAKKNKASSKDEAEVQELMKLYAKLTPENRTILLAAAKGLAQDK